MINMQIKSKLIFFFIRMQIWNSMLESKYKFAVNARRL